MTPRPVKIVKMIIKLFQENVFQLVQLKIVSLALPMILLYVKLV